MHNWNSKSCDFIPQNSDFEVINIYLNNLPEPLSDKEQYELFKMYKKTKNKDIRKKLIERNLRLVVSISKRFIKNWFWFWDLIQEWNIWLIKAIEKYDIYKWAKFSYYAEYWIKQEIKRFIQDNKKNIRIPITTQETIQRISKLYVLHWDNISSSKIGELTDMTYESVERCLKAKNIWTESSILSKDWEIGSIFDFIDTGSDNSPEKIAEFQQLRMFLNEALCKLNEVQLQAIIMKFLMDYTYNDITNEEWISSSTMDQRNKKWLQIMHDHFRREKLLFNELLG